MDKVWHLEFLLFTLHLNIIFLFMYFHCFLFFSLAWVLFYTYSFRFGRNIFYCFICYLLRANNIAFRKQRARKNLWILFLKNWITEWKSYGCMDATLKYPVILMAARYGVDSSVFVHLNGSFWFAKLRKWENFAKCCQTCHWKSHFRNRLKLNYQKVWCSWMTFNRDTILYGIQLDFSILVHSRFRYLHIDIWFSSSYLRLRRLERQDSWRDKKETGVIS